MPNRIERTSSLPLDLFHDAAVFDLELGEIWQKDWIFATPVDAVSEPGDFVLVEIGRQSVIVVRGQDHEIRALANVCSHRGTPLVEASGKNVRFACPYHAWTYDTTGALRSVPYATAGEVISEEHGLEQFRVDEWQGLLFVSLNDRIEPLADRLSVVDAYVSPLALRRLHHDVSSVSDETWDANWKAIYANAVDGYSHFRVHPETIEPVSPTDATYYLAGSAHATVSGGESGDRADHVVIAVPPSFVAIAYPDALLWQALRPLAVDRTRVLTGVAAEQPVDSGKPAHLPGWDAAFVDEDRAICERVQRGAAARFTPGPLLDIEQPLGDFHDYLAWRLVHATPAQPVIAAPPGQRPDPKGP